VALASQLKRSDSAQRTKALVVPEGTWGLGNFIEQCKEDPNPHTLGAFIVLPPSLSTQKDNYLFLIRSSATLSFNVMAAVCKEDGTADVEWESNTQTGRYGRSVIQFLPFAILTSIYLAFVPQRTFQNTTVTAYPTPNPLPPGGARSSVQTLSSSVINSSGTAALQNNVVGAVGLESLLVGREGAPDNFTAHAAADAARDFVRALRDECDGEPGAGRAPAPASSPVRPAPYCSW